MSSFKDYYCAQKCDEAEHVCQALVQNGIDPPLPNRCRKEWAGCFSGCVPNPREALYATTPNLTPAQAADVLRWTF
jgi:hypothetical protein